MKTSTSSFIGDSWLSSEDYYFSSKELTFSFQLPKAQAQDKITVIYYGDDAKKSTDSFRPKDLSLYQQIHFRTLSDFHCRGFITLRRIRNTDAWDKLAIVLQQKLTNEAMSPSTDILDQANMYTEMPYAYRGKMTKKNAEYYFFHRYDLSTV